MNWEDIISIVIASISGLVFSIMLIVYLASHSYRKTQRLKHLKSRLMKHNDAPMVKAVVGAAKYRTMLNEVKKLYPNKKLRDALSEYHQQTRPNTLALHGAVQDRTMFSDI